MVSICLIMDDFVVRLPTNTFVENISKSTKHLIQYFNRLVKNSGVNARLHFEEIIMALHLNCKIVL